MPNARQHRLVDVLGQDGVEVIDASGLGDSHGLLLRGPKEREIDPFGQGLGGQLWRLPTGGDHLDDLGCRLHAGKRQHCRTGSGV